MGVFIFVAVVAVVVWFIYSGLRRQDARLGSAAPATRVQDDPLQEWQQPPTVSAEPLAPVPLFVNFQQSFRGEPNKIVQTLNDVADMLQNEVDARTFPNGQATNTTCVDHETYRNLVSQQTNRLMLMFQDAEIGFERAASSAGGTPEMLRQVYAAFLDQLIAAARSFGTTQAPPTYAQTEATFREFLKEFYGQIAEWPKTLHEASKDVSDNAYDVLLSANYDVGPMQRAILTESA